MLVMFDDIVVVIYEWVLVDGWLVGYVLVVSDDVFSSVFEWGDVWDVMVEVVLQVFWVNGEMCEFYYCVCVNVFQMVM